MRLLFLHLVTRLARVSLVISALLLASAPLLTSAPCDAQRRGRSARTERTERARDLVARARTALDAGDLVTARDAFRQAYELTENPAMLYNLGLVEDQAGNLDAAGEHLRAFLRTSPGPAERALAEERLADIGRRRQALEDAAIQARAEPVVTQPDPSVTAGGPAASDATGRDVDYAPFGVTLGVGSAIGAGLLVLSGVFWSDANAGYAGLVSSCMTRCSSQQITDSGAPLAVDLTNTFLVAGIATLGLTAVASVLVLVASSPGAEPTADHARVRLRIAPGSLALDGVF
jgi:hypothetical protein